MNDAKAVAFLQELLVKTREGKIRWRPSAIEETYVSAFGGKFGLTISDNAYLSRESWGRTSVAETAGKLMQGFVLKVSDVTREVIRIEPEEPSVLADNLKKLYETVRKQALTVDDAKLDSVLAELQRL